MYKIVIVILVLLSSLNTYAQDSVSVDLPISIPNFSPVPLRSLIDKEFEEKLMAKIGENKYWANLISKKKLAVGVVDLSKAENVKFARINGNEMMYAASLPKLGILLAAMDAIDKGELKEDPGIVRDMNRMIRVSDNASASRLIDRLGFDKIESVLTDPKYEFYDEEYGGGLWVGKRYAREGNRNPDPIKGLSHAATVSQVCRFYYLLAYGRLVNFESSKKMLKIMQDPKIHHKFVHTLDRIAPNAKIFRKSGTWRIWHSDSMLVWGTVWRRYILVALVEDDRGETILRNLVTKVEEVLTYDDNETTE